ncbi:MAG: NRDE family protein [Aquabacterium sp.]|nr:NRDE family protein [Aquabacterium sp.]
MCLIALAIDQSRRFPLVIAANRDEFFARPAARLGWWTPDAGGPAVLAGRDLEAGGTWLGLTAQGRLAMVTNVRNPSRVDPAAPSRGQIVPQWLSGREPTDRFWMRTALLGYNGFNLIAADFKRGECFWASNLDAHPKRLERGTYGVSNAALDTAWPKTNALKSRVREALSSADSVDALSTALFAALTDRRIADDANLPSTGVPLELERELSAAFIRAPERQYGTRCSTLVISERVGRGLITHVMERSYTASGAVSLLRQAALKGWPPRYSDDADTEPVEQAVVSDAPRTRVRSLLKPAVAPRRSAKAATP